MRLRGRARRELEVLDACEAEQDFLDEAKQAYTDDPNEETRTAKREAMASYAETRSWLRAVAAIRKRQLQIAELAAATDEESVARREFYEADLARLQRDFGPLIAAMEQLAGQPGPGPGADDVPAAGSVSVSPRTVRGRTRVGRES